MTEDCCRCLCNQDDDDRRFPLMLFASSTAMYSTLTAVLATDHTASAVAWRILQSLPPHQPLYHSLLTLTIPAPTPTATSAAGKKPVAAGKASSPPPALPINLKQLFAPTHASLLLYKLMVRTACSRLPPTSPIPHVFCCVLGFSCAVVCYSFGLPLVLIDGWMEGWMDD
jgi:hypothetical protein